jgi:ABC-type polysaccharide/polyol phosphate export permease
LGSQILTINLLWSVSYSFQVHVNFPVAFDLWSREFIGILQEGVTPQVMAVARAAFGMCAGLVIFVLGFLGVIILFPVDSVFLLRLVEALPLVLGISLGLGTAINGVLYYVGRSYNFLSWTILQFVVVFSSPFTPMKSLSVPVRLIAYLSPYSYPFEFIRSGEWSVYCVGLILSLLGFVGGMVVHTYLYDLARKHGKTVTT